MALAIDEYGAGEGEPLVLIHGVGTWRRVWHRVAPLIADERRVLAADVPGFGDSPPLGPGFDLNETAAALDRLLARLPAG